MADEPSYEDLADQVSTLIAEANAAGQDSGSLASIRKALRRADKRVQEAETQGYERAKAEQAHGQAFDRLQVPAALRGLFTGIDPTDQAAMDAKVADLRAQGVTWQTTEAPPTQGQQPNPMAEQVAGMAAATSGGGVPDPAGDLIALAAKARTNPADVDPDALLAQVNQAINAAGSAGRGAGILG